MIQFTAYGVAQPKGSARAFVPKGWTRPVITSTTRGLKAWESVVRQAAQRVASGTLLIGALYVRVTFYLPRPKSLPKKQRQHTKRPDLDKLVRGSLDAMRQVIWHDDAQVVRVEAEKRYADDGLGSRATFVIGEYPS